MWLQVMTKHNLLEAEFHLLSVRFELFVFLIQREKGRLIVTKMVECKS
jgi:hypothetical protein